MGSALRVGMVGVGKISEQYFASLPKFPGLELVAVADVDEARLATAAAAQRVKPLSVDQLMASPYVDAVLNLTIPAAHSEITVKALESGKHVYSEKPIALSPGDAAEMLGLMAERELRLGSAPDTVLGTGIQTARQLLDSGRIGSPVAATAFWGSPGHERWHPNPAFYYQAGGGPVFDMGPYYVTALVTLLGPVVRVAGTAEKTARARTVATGPLAGTAIDVGVDTHVSALLEHASGQISTVTLSFDVWASDIPNIEVYGTSGTIHVPDPNHFSDPVKLWTSDEPSWKIVTPTAGYADASRGVGLADLARALDTGRPHRASAELAFHVLEIMDAIIRAGHEHRDIHIVSTVERPAPVPFGVTPDTW